MNASVRILLPDGPIALPIRAEIVTAHGVTQAEFIPADLLVWQGNAIRVMRDLLATAPGRPPSATETHERGAKAYGHGERTIGTAQGQKGGRG